MTQPVDLSLVIPIYQEARTIRSTVETVLETLRASARSFEVIVVSDGSTDDPRTPLAPLLRSEPNLRLIEYAPNRGKGAAVRAGFAEARGERVLFSDADLSTPLDEIAKLDRALDAGADIALGSRRLPGSRIEEAQGLLRRAIGREFPRIVRLLTGLPVADSQCGFKMFTREAARRMVDDSRVDGFSFDVEWLCLARESGFTAREVPVRWRNSDRSTVRPVRHSLQMAGAVLSLSDPVRLPRVHARQIALASGVGLALLLLLQIGMSVLLPLFDNTEGRYGAIALDMQARGDWVTPWIWEKGENIPFWGKPPLFFWLAAGSLRVFGAQEFAARLPSLLASIGTVLLTARVARAYHGGLIAWLASLILGSSLLFFLCSGIVALDPLASFCVTGIIASMALATRTEELHRGWGYGVFLFVGLGMLTKGPIVILLGAGPIVLYALWGGTLSRLRSLPWLGGTVLATAITLPWYLIAEARTPGFLEYFFYQEHLLRYLKEDYGDRYGKAHVQPRGMIWAMLGAGLLPWLTLAATAGRGGARTAWRTWTARHGATRLLLLWAVLPALFFTPARSVLATYVLPGLGAWSILLAIELDRQLSREQGWRRALLAPIGFLVLGSTALLAVRFAGTVAATPGVIESLFVAVVACAVIAVKTRSRGAMVFAVPVLLALLVLQGVWGLREQLETDLSTRSLVAQIDERTQEPTMPIVLVGRGEPSIDFYAPGRVIHLRDAYDERIPGLLHDGRAQVYVVRNRQAEVVAAAGEDVQLVRTRGSFTLLLEGDAPRTSASAAAPTRSAGSPR